MPSQGNSLGRGRGRGNDSRNHQLKFCKTEINRKSDEIKCIYQSKSESPLIADKGDEEGVCYFLRSRLPTSQGTGNGKKVTALRDTGCTGCVVRRSLVSSDQLLGKESAVDIVGPIEPRSERKSRYILTMIDYATRYPEAVALPGIETERVAEALVEMFSRVGIPDEMLTDCGSQFTAEVMKEVSRLLSLQQISTTLYHPICNGLIERFHMTLKQMLRRMCAERPKDWDKYLPALLFAIREVPQESLGFSPFELLYGRNVKDPMAILRELWSGEAPDEQVLSTYQYVIELRDRLEQTCKLAHENLKKVQIKQKAYYDRRARSRKFDVGDKVLLLLPTDSNKLLFIDYLFKDPYEVVEVVYRMDFKIDVNGVVSTYHANMLKQYVERRNELSHCLLSAEAIESVDDDDNEEFPLVIVPFRRRRSRNRTVTSVFQIH